jgi:hypothetical protein
MRMRRNYFISRLALVVLALAFVGQVTNAQTRRTGRGRTPSVRTTTTTAAPAAPVLLPASDGVMLVEMRRLLTEAMPRALASDVERVAQVTADIEQFRTRTGIDARNVERVAVGARFTTPAPDVTKIDDVVAVADGTFDISTIAATARQSAKAGYRAENYGGKTIYIFNLNERLKFFGVMPSIMVREVALTMLDADTLAVGDPVGVRATIDAFAGRGRVSAELVALARQQPGALIGFSANVPRALLAKADGFGSDELTQSINSIRQVYGSVAATAGGFDVLTTMRAATAADARRLGETVKALKPLGMLYASQRSGDKGEFLQKAIESLQVTAQGTDVQLKLAFTQADIATMLRVF